MTELMLTMAPPPVLTISRATACPTRNEPLRLTSKTASQSASVMSRNSAAEDAGVVDEHVDAAEGSDGGGDGGIDFAASRDVACEWLCARAARTELRGERLRRGRVDVPQRHRGAAGREQARAGGADAVACAGDDGDLAGEIEPDLFHAATRSSQMAMPCALSSRSS